MKIWTSFCGDRATAEEAVAERSCPSCGAAGRVGEPEAAEFGGGVIRTGPGTILTVVPIRTMHDDDCPEIAMWEAARAAKDASR